MFLFFFNLVGGFKKCFSHLEKYEFVNGKDYISHILWNIKKNMFETTKQLL